MGIVFSTEDDATTSKTTYTVHLTGVWRGKGKSDIKVLEEKMKACLANKNANFDIRFEILDQENEGKKQAVSALNILNKNGLVRPLIKKPEAKANKTQGISGALGLHNMFYTSGEVTNLAIFVGSGRSSTQFTVINLDWQQPVKVFKTPHGFPREGEPNYTALRETANECVDWCGVNNVRLIVGYDSIFHKLKETAPVIQDETELPTNLEGITTKGQDFNELGFLVAHFQYIPMIVFRSVVTVDGIMRKQTFVEGTQPGIDGGSGKWALVDPQTGNQITYMELPKDFTNDEVKLGEIVDKCFTMVLNYNDQMLEILN